MFISYLKKSLLAGIIIMNYQLIYSDQNNGQLEAILQNEEAVLAKTISQVMPQVQTVVEEFKKISASSQQIVVDLFSTLLLLSSKRFNTQEEAQTFELNICQLLDNNAEVKEFYLRTLSSINTLCQPYYAYLEQLYKAAESSLNKSANKDEQLENLRYELIFKAFSFEQQVRAFFYHHLYEYLKNSNPDNLIALLDQDGTVLPAQKRSKKILSVQEIELVLQEAQQAANA